jgi:hypothetical protein
MQSHLHRIEGELLEVKKLILALGNHSPNKIIKSEEEAPQKTVI